MIDCTFFQGKKVAVLGLGKSGRHAVLALQKADVEVIAWDDNKGVHTPDIPLVDFHHYDMRDLDMLVISPGIPHTLPAPNALIQKARDAGVQIVNDVHLFKQSYDGDIIAVTGTNGKSTTTALMGHVLSRSGERVQVGGNIGTALMSLDQECPISVTELSSYQTEITDHLNARGVIWLNITPDHLDRHGDMDGYVRAKAKIFETSQSSGLAVICIDDTYSVGIFQDITKTKKWRVIPISTHKVIPDGVSIVAGEIYDHGVRIGDMKNAVRLKGEHNHQNAACVYAMARHLYDIPSDVILSQLTTFKGLSHRQYHVRHIGNVDYINDSKATNAQATEQALKSYHNIYWLAGGVAKDGGIETLMSYFTNVKKAYLYGASAQDFADSLKNTQIAHATFATLEDATHQAHQDAHKDISGTSGNAEHRTVLLSPACASFDQYENFEKRGDHFEHIVSDLAK